MPESADHADVRRRDLVTSVAVAVGLAALIARALPALVQAYWIDEAGTWWLIDGGWSELVARWRQWPYQSLAHNAVALAAKQLLGPHEWALRLPSLLAAAASLVLFHRLARRLIGSLGAAAALLALVGSPSFYFALTMARPYAFGLFALLVSWSALIVWTPSSAARRYATWAIASAVVAYFHYTLALGLAAQLPWLATRWRRADARERRAMALAAATALLLCLPLAGSLRATAAQLPALEMFHESAPAINPLTVLTPTALGFSLLLVVAAAFACGAWPVVATRPVAPDALRVIAPLWLLPTAATFAAHVLRLAALNQDRYQLAGQVGLALAVGLTVEHLGVRAAQRTSLALLALLVPFTAASSFWPLYDGRDWRAAAAASQRLATDDDLVLAPSQFIESNHPSQFGELAAIGRLSAQLVAYPVRGNVLVLPRDVEPETTGFAKRRLAEERVALRQRVFLVQMTGGPWLPWFLRTHPEFELARRYHWGRLDWLVFARRTAPIDP